MKKGKVVGKVEQTLLGVFQALEGFEEYWRWNGCGMYLERSWIWNGGREEEGRHTIVKIIKINAETVKKEK